MMKILACTALVLSVLAPVVLGHHQTGAPGMVDVMLNPSHVDTNRNGGAATGVSGHYVTDPAAVDAAHGGGSSVTLAPAIAIRCDLEVLGDGTGGPEDERLDETIVDSVPAGAVAPNGMWDDGGVGGACHVTSYSNAAYNAPGCPDGARVSAEDSVSGGAVWIAVGCDDTKAAAGGMPDAQVFALCVAKGLGGGIVLDDLVGCVTTFISCTAPPGPVTACLTPAPPVCGADNLVDSVQFGTGNGHTSPSVAFRASGCLGGAASVFVLTAVNQGVGIVNVVSPATTGWIDQD